MKKMMVVLIILFCIPYPFLIFYGPYFLSKTLPIIGNCNVLPNNIKYKIVLRDELFELKDTGLVEIGYIARGIRNAKFSNTTKTFYFYDNPNVYANKYNLYRTDVFARQSRTTPLLENMDKYSISPDGNFIVYNNANADNLNNINLLNIKSGKKLQLAADFNNDHNPLWINNHQFLYQSTCYHNENKLYLFDINSRIKKDMLMDGYFPGTATSDGKKILLAKNGKTILYDIQNGAFKILEYKKMYIDNAIWLPDDSGFIYSDTKWRDFGDTFEEPRGLYYYSLNKKRSVRLMKLFQLKLEGGFVVPIDVDIPLEDTKLNKSYPLPLTKSGYITKICAHH